MLLVSRRMGLWLSLSIEIINAALLRAFLVAVILVCAWAPLDAQTVRAHPVAGNSFVIRNVRIFDGERVLAERSVVVRRGLIASIGEKRSDRNLPIVDGGGRLLTPGLIDAHVHLLIAKPSEGAPPTAERAAVRFGVTTEVDLFNLTDGFLSWRRAREALQPTDRADIFSAGVGATAPGGHPSQIVRLPFPTVSRAADADAFVATQVDAGADFIKLFLEDGDPKLPAPLPTLSRDVVRALVKAAHARGKLVIAHAKTRDYARMAIEEGVDGLSHMVSDRPLDSAFLALAKRKGIFVIATLPSDATFAAASDGAHLADELKGSWRFVRRQRQWHRFEVVI